MDGILRMKLPAKLISPLLIASMVLLPLPGHAALIGTDHVVAGVSWQGPRDKLLAFVDRADVRKQMEALGLDPSTARDRVSALTDEEVERIADQLDSIPAGASSTAAAWITAGVILVAIALYLVWK